MLSPHAAGKSAKTEEEKAAIRDIVKRDNDEAANLVMPLKMARTLMQTGLVTDPEFERDCEGLTKEDRRLKEEERNKSRNLYRPEWVKSMQLWSPELRSALESGAFQVTSLDPGRGMGSTVRSEYIRLQKIWKGGDFGELTCPDNKYFHDHFLSDVPAHEGGEDASIFLTPREKLVRVLKITCAHKNVGTQKLTAGKWSRFVGPCPSREEACDFVDAVTNMPASNLAKITKEWAVTPGVWCQSMKSKPDGWAQYHDKTMGKMLGPLHAYDTEGDQFHWRCELRSTDWLKLAHEHGAKFTARQLYSYYMSLPAIISSKVPGKDKQKREDRLQG